MKKAIVSLSAVCLALLLGACCTICCKKATAEKFTVNNVYGSHMVLQRQKPIQIVGKAEAGKSVKVAIGKNSTVATADKDGVWKAVLPAMEAGGPYTVTVSGAKGSKAVVFNDVLIGEVWFCSGQSNMQMPVFSNRPFWSSKNGRQEAAAANYPNIRIFQVTRAVSPGIEKDAVVSRDGWEVCTPQTIGKFSACGYYFGRELHKDLNVPIGLINSSWGGTRIEPWISENGYITLNRKEELTRIRSAKVDNEQKMKKATAAKGFTPAKRLAVFYSAHADKTAAANNWKTPGLDTSAWDKVTLSNNISLFAPMGVFWFRRTITLPAECAEKDLTLNLGAIDDLDETFFNGELVGTTTINDKNYWNAIRKYTIPGKLVKAGENTIAIRISNIKDAGGFTRGTKNIRCGNKTYTLNGEWLTKCEFKLDMTHPVIEQFELCSAQFPATLYNAMVKPWTVYPMRGFIWYQGCSNASNAKDYMNLHPLLIQDWRNHWNDQTMPFVFTQLAAYERHTPRKRLTDAYLSALQPRENNFANLREVQTATLKVPLTGMAVTIDIGDHSDIHPANKQDLAYRMAQEAKRLVYGYKGVTAGPMYKSMKIEGDKIRIEFTNIGKGLKVKGDKLNCFAIAEKNGKFVWANAKLDGNSVVVWSDQVKEPANVRYAWAGFPVNPNLYNQEGFPASPFRTDMPDYLLK